MKMGKIYGVGLGPGAQDLMSVRADRLIRSTRYIAYFRKAGRNGHARTIVDGMFLSNAIEIAMEYPVTTEIPVSDSAYNRCLSAFYEECVQGLMECVRAGNDVVVLCEGDPFFFGSFMHLYTRLQHLTEVTVIPGITGMSAAWTATNRPITWGDDVLTVLMATLSEEELVERIVKTDALVVMKIGRNLSKLKRALAAANREDDAFLVEYAAMDKERICALKDSGETVPYFSIVLIHGNGRRP